MPISKIFLGIFIVGTTGLASSYAIKELAFKNSSKNDKYEKADEAIGEKDRMSGQELESELSTKSDQVSNEDPQSSPSEQL